MIYTVTFNPAIDYTVHIGSIVFGDVNRVRQEHLCFGGKGLNVSMILKELGIPSKALGFVAGFTGAAIEDGMRAQGIETDFIRLANGFSRINVKIKSDAETELNGQGPAIDGDSLEAFFAKLEQICDGDTVVLAGSVPASLPADVYQRILERLSNRSLRIAVDAAKDLLMNALAYQPFLIKPNLQELGELFGSAPGTLEEVEADARRLQQMGARNVLVSMAGEGALLLDEKGNARFQQACKGTVRNSVGAGDSMVAGFLAGMEQGDYAYALRLGTAAGGATAFSDTLATGAEIRALLGEMGN